MNVVFSWSQEFDEFKSVMNSIRWIELYMGSLSVLKALHTSKANWNGMIGLFFMKGVLPTGNALIAWQQNALKALNL